VRQQFAGYLRNDSFETSTDFAGARYYRRSHGRFATPDEALVDQDPADPMSWNLYGFVRNNPLRYSDPSGRKCVERGKFIEDDSEGEPCDFTVYATAYAKQEEVEPVHPSARKASGVSECKAGDIEDSGSRRRGPP
jgi:RHS repeat-associated protein